MKSACLLKLRTKLKHNKNLINNSDFEWSQISIFTKSQIDTHEHTQKFVIMSQILLHSSTKQLGTFPLKLYDMLEDAEKHGFDDIISWTPDGIGFKVHRPNDLVEQILPLYFDQQTRYKSFQRQLNMYEFKMLRKATKGTYEEHLKGAFFHPFFVRGKRESSAIIPRKSCSRANEHTPPYFRGRFVILTALPEYHNGGAINNNNMGGSFQQKWHHYPLLGSASPTIIDPSSLPFYGYNTIHTPLCNMQVPSDTLVYPKTTSTLTDISGTTPNMVNTFFDTTAEGGFFSCSTKIHQQTNDLPIIPPSLNSQGDLDMILPNDSSMQGSEDYMGAGTFEFDNNHDNDTRKKPDASLDDLLSWPWHKEHEDELLDYAKHIISSTNNHHHVACEVNNRNGSETDRLGSTGSMQARYFSDIDTNRREDDHDVIEDIISTFSIPTTI